MTLMAPEPPKQAPAWEILPLGRGGWRICDGAREHSDASRLVAYVEKSDAGTLEVLWLRSPCPTRSRYRNFDDLLADLNAAVDADRANRSARPWEIPHFPPIASADPLDI